MIRTKNLRSPSPRPGFSLAFISRLTHPLGLGTEISATSSLPWKPLITTYNHESPPFFLKKKNRETCRFLHRKRERLMPAQLESAQTEASELDHWVCSHPTPEAVQNLGWKWKPLLFCEFQAQWTYNWTKKAKSESYFGTVKRLMLDPLSSNVLFNTVHRIGFCGVPIMCVGSGNGLKWV